MTLQLVDDDLAGLADAIWTSITGIAADPVAPGTAPAGHSVAACVNISGGWSGSVTVVLPWDLAVDVAATMFDVPTAELDRSEILDAVGELANIAGGNVKGMIEGPSALSLPIVAEGSDQVLTVPGARVTAEATMAHDGIPFAIQIHERA